MAAACLLPGSASAIEQRSVVESFGRDGTSETEFLRPEELAFDQSNNRLYVLDQISNQIDGYSVPSAGTHTPLGGSFPLTATGAGSGDDIGVDSSSHDLYFASTGESKLFGFDSSGAALDGFPISGVSFACGVAVDSSGDVWVSETFEGNLKKYSPAGILLQTVTVGGEPCDLAIDSQDNIYVAAFNGGTTKYTAASNYTASSQIDADAEVSKSVAVDQSTDEVYVVHNKYISAYEADGTLLYQFGKAYGAGNGKFTGVAINQATEQVYASTKRENKVLVFGPPPRLPKVSTEGADGITATTATVHGTVIPEGEALTDCHFDAIPNSQFQASEFTAVTAAQEFPCVPAAGSIPADSNPHAVSANLSGLETATMYRYRLVATSAVGTANGFGHSFISAAEAPLVKEQLVESVGTGEATLQAKINPKGGETTYHVEYGTTNAYGQSTPESAPIGASIDRTDHLVSVHVGGLSPGTAYHFRFVATNSVGSAQGSDVSFATYPEVSASSGSCPNEQFRTGFGAHLPDCRGYEQATPIDKHGADAQGEIEMIEASSSGDRVTFFVAGGLPTSGGSSSLYPYIASRSAGGWSSDGILPPTDPGTGGANVLGWDEDLSTVVGIGPGPGNVGKALYLHDSATGAYQLGPGDPNRLFGSLADFADDTSNLLFESESQLLPEALAGKENVYELDHGTLTLVGRIPAGSATSCDDESGPACVVAPEGSFAGPYSWDGNGNTEFGGARSGLYTQNTISADGSKVFFTARGTGQLYMREDGTRTVQISASQKTNGTGPGGTDPLGPKPAAWMASTPSGSKVLFSSAEELTNDANTGQDPAIGRAGLDGTVVERSFVPTNAGGVIVDGSHIYWTEPKANSIGRANLDGTGIEPSFIAAASKPQGIAVNGSFIYWTNAGTGADGTGTIGRANLDGTGVQQSFITGASNPQGIAVDATHIYWGNAGTTEATQNIGRANLDGTEPNQAFVPVVGIVGPRGVAVDAGHIYWANPSQGLIGRAPVGGGTDEQVFIHGTSNNPITPTGVAVDAGHIYWANPDRFGGEGTIGRANLDGTGIEPSFIDHIVNAQAISVDAAHLYWASSGSRDQGRDLYQYDTASGELTDLTADSNPSDVKGAAVLGLMGTSKDDSYVYFAANGALAPGASSGNCDSGSGQCDLYVFHNGTITFIARVRNDQGVARYNWTPRVNGNTIERRLSRVSPDGRTLLFTSTTSLTGYDNIEASPGHCAESEEVKPCQELFRYSAPEGQLRCISCNPTGMRPQGSAVLGTDGRVVLRGILHFTLLTRNLSADGNRIFFDSRDALVPADTNGVSDVYEWEAKGSGSCQSESQNGGCLYLLSGGDGESPSYFGDASVNGDHVFIFSNQRLVPGDEDDLYDVYDVGVGAGLAAQHPLTPATCTTTACQANPAPPPDQTAASAVFSGQGNVHAHSARKCPKGKRKVRKAGKVSCLKAHKQSKRHSNRGGAK